MHTAVIQEGIRLSYGLSTRLSRSSPYRDLQYKEWTIPKGVVVGMTSYLVHNDETIFPQPELFLPERWLEDKGRKGAARLDRYILSFGKGTRQCLGMRSVTAREVAEMCVDDAVVVWRTRSSISASPE